MLTISQLAAYAGVTVRAVRHYHQIGLLPEPERTYSGYRTYDAAAVVRLIRIRTLADAGVPLARVQELLDAGPEEFARGVQEIDKDLRAEIRRLQDNRKRHRPARRRRAPGAPAQRRGLPRPAARPRRRRALHRARARQLDHDRRPGAGRRSTPSSPASTRSSTTPTWSSSTACSAEAVDWPADDPRIVEIADILERLMIRAVEAGETGYRPLRRPVRRPAGRDRGRVLTGRRATSGDPAGARLEGLDPHRASAHRPTRPLSILRRGCGPGRRGARPGARR